MDVEAGNGIEHNAHGRSGSQLWRAINAALIATEGEGWQGEDNAVFGQLESGQVRCRVGERSFVLGSGQRIVETTPTTVRILTVAGEVLAEHRRVYSDLNELARTRRAGAGA